MSEDITLVAEQIRHLLDLKEAEVNAVKADLVHYRELTDRRLDDLEKDREDHEQRIRDLRDGMTQFKMFAGLASGGSTIMAVIALIKAFFGAM